MALTSYPDALRKLFGAAEAAYEQWQLGNADLKAAYEGVSGLVLQLEQFRMENPRSTQGHALSGRRDVYEFAVTLAYSLGYEAEAFEHAERARARSLLDQTLNKMPLRFRNGADKQLLEREADLTRRINSLTQELIGGPFGSRGDASEDMSAQAPSIPGKSPFESETELRRARAELLEIRQLIRDQDPAFAALRGITPASLADVQTLLDPDTALVSYCLTEERLIIFVTTARGFWTQHVDIRRTTLSGLIAEFRELVETSRGRTRDIVISDDPSAMPEEAPPEDERAAVLGGQLYDVLIRPVLPHIRRKSRLALVPHGDLHLLPFNALRGERGYLIEQFAIWYAPSISLLDLCYQRQRRSQGRLLAAANPRLGSPTWDLPFAEQEAIAIAALFEAQVRIGEEATLSNLRALWEQADILHLACHALWDPEQPEFAALLLTPTATDTGRLEVHELFTLDHDLPLAQVTLSACQTSMVAGNDVTGLATGFLCAGAPAVVASLWRVDDHSTADLMVEFYNELATRDRASALQSAQLAIGGSGPYRDPYYWAAFKLIGNPLHLHSERQHTASAFNSVHLWTYRAESGVLARPSAKGSMVFATWSDPADTFLLRTSVWGISLKEEKLLWKRDIPGWPRAFCYVPGLVHIEAGSQIYALHASSGEIVWRHEMSSSLTQSLLFDGTLLYAGGHSSSVCALHPETGEIRWEHELPRDASGGFALGHGLVFVGCNDHSVYALKASNGFTLWRTGLSWGNWSGGHWRVTDESLETEIGAFDLATGGFDNNLRIEKKGPEHGRISPELLARTPIGVEITYDTSHLLRTFDLVFTTETAGDVTHVYMFNSDGGRLLRRYDLPSPDVTGMSRDGETLVIGDGHGALHCFSLAKAGSNWGGENGPPG